jgi:hypothetical protein
MVSRLTPVDCTGIPIKKCRHGRAIGADDLANWTSRRRSGKSGVFVKKDEKRLKKWGKEKNRALGEQRKKKNTTWVDVLKTWP